MLDILMLISGLGLLVLGAELLVRGASQLARLVGIPSLVIGLTIVAFGTSAPELAVGIKAGLEGKADIAAGNVFGSNIFNVLLILGLAACVVPLKVKQRLVRLDVPLMILVSGLAWLFAADGRISFSESILLFLLLLGYLLFTGLFARRHPMQEPSADGEDAVPVRLRRTVLWSVVFLFVGLALLVLGARWLVEGASGIARLAGVSELTIGLVVVAGGTSLPELVTSLVAGLRGERDIAVGNVVGSNIFNLLCVLPMAGLASIEGLSVAGAIRELDLPVMFATAVVCLPIFLTGAVISRLEGIFFLVFYGLYAALVVLRSLSSPFYGVLADAFFYVLFPGTALFIVVMLWYEYHEIKVMTDDLSGDFADLAGGATKHARKLVITVAGVTVILVGVAMMVLPGPATIVIPLGLAILSTEYIWARRLLNYLRKEVETAAYRLMGTPENKDE